jgi:hypothetical protein
VQLAEALRLLRQPLEYTAILKQAAAAIKKLPPRASRPADADNE